MVIPPRSRPSTGEMTMKMAVLPRKCRSSEPKPALATAAPAKPPNKACDEDDGSASHQVRTSQIKAPIRPLATTVSETTLLLTPCAMLLATVDSNNKNAMKLKNAAQSTATRGLSTRVETTVAI